MNPSASRPEGRRSPKGHPEPRFPTLPSKAGLRAVEWVTRLDQTEKELIQENRVSKGKRAEGIMLFQLVPDPHTDTNTSSSYCQMRETEVYRTAFEKEKELTDRALKLAEIGKL